MKWQNYPIVQELPPLRQHANQSLGFMYGDTRESNALIKVLSI